MSLRSASVALGLATLLLATLAGCSFSARGPSLLPPISTDRLQETFDTFDPFVATSASLRVLVRPVPKGVTAATSLVVEADKKLSTKRKLLLIAGTACKKVHKDLQCTLALPLGAGTHALSIVAFAGKKKLSVNNLFVDLTDCKTNSILTSLYAPAASIAVVPESDWIIGSLARGYQTQDGLGPFGITIRDKGGNTIVGPGTPAIVVKSSNAKIAVTTSAPNTFVLALNKSEPVGNTQKTKVSVTAGTAKLSFSFSTEFSTVPTPTPSPKPKPCSTGGPSSSPSGSPSGSPSPTPTHSPTPPPTPTPTPPGPTPSPNEVNGIAIVTPAPLASAVVFVTYADSSRFGSVLAYDESGNQQPAGSFSGSGKPLGIIWVPAAPNWFYLVGQDTGTGFQSTVQVYEGNGSHLSSFTFGETSANAIAYDATSTACSPASGCIYVSNGTTVHAYGVDGGATPSPKATASPGFGTGAAIQTTPYSLTADTHIHRLFLGEANGYNNIEEYAENGAIQTLGGGTFSQPTACHTACLPYALAFDSHLNYIWVIWVGNSIIPSVVGYDDSTFKAQVTFTGLSNPQAIAFDAHNNELYITDGPLGVKVFTEAGAQVTLGSGAFTPH